MKLIMEGWRDFLDKSGKKPKPEEKKEKKKPSREEKMRAYLVKHGGVTDDEAKQYLEKQVDLEEAEELEEGFPQPDPDYDYEYKRRSGRADSPPRFSLVQDPQYKEASEIYLSEPLQKARQSLMALPHGDPQQEEAREALVAAIQQAVEGDKDLFAQVVAQMEEEERLAR